MPSTMLTMKNCVGNSISFTAPSAVIMLMNIPMLANRSLVGSLPSPKYSVAMSSTRNMYPSV